MASRTQHPDLPPLKDDPDPGRAALRRANLRYSYDQIIEAGKLDQGPPPLLTIDTVRRFAVGITQNFGAKRRKRLEAFLFDNPIGRGMVEASLGDESSSDRLITALASGNSTRPANSVVAGLYYVYHGSYLAEHHFALRVVEIAARNNELSVTDWIRETISGQKELHIAHGCAVFFGHPPHLHIITNAEENDNRLGLSLFVGTSPVFRDNVLTEAAGTMIGMTREGRRFFRHCILMRQPLSPLLDQEEYKQAREDMINNTGVFALAELDKPHRAAFDTLLRRLKLPLNREPFADPIQSVRMRKRVKPKSARRSVATTRKHPRVGRSNRKVPKKRPPRSPR